MAFLEVAMVQVREVIRRWQAGESKTGIGQASGVSRRTVGRYIAAAEALGGRRDSGPPGEEVLAQLLQRNHAGPLPQVESPTAARLAGQKDRIARWLREEELQFTRILELLVQDGIAVSYTGLRRHVRQAGLWRTAKTTVRMAPWPAGEVAELDFGKLGMLTDPETLKKRAVWALVVVLPYSRHQFVYPLARQTLEECIAGLESAWRFFGGVPKRLILDNFAAAIAGPDALTPWPTRGFLEYSQARGFLIDAARVRRPKDKPHVERSVQYVRERFFKGSNFRDLEDCREQAKRWCREIAGLRVHGTTRRLPREVFEAEEPAQLQPFAGVLYDVPQWKAVTAHPDHHISFGQARYSAPAAACPPGTKLEVRGDRGLVKLYKKGELVKVHPRQHRGGCLTDPDDYPAEKTAYAMRAPDRIIERASVLGPNVETFVTKLFEGPLPWAKSARARNCSRSAKSTPLHGSMPLAHGHCLTNSSMSAVSTASSCARSMPRAAGRGTAQSAGKPLRASPERLRPSPPGGGGTSLEPDLAALLRRLKLGKVLPALPDRLALARAQKLDYAAFLTLVIADEVQRRDNLALERRLLAAGFEERVTLEQFD